MENIKILVNLPTRPFLMVFLTLCLWFKISNILVKRMNVLLYLLRDFRGFDSSIVVSPDSCRDVNNLTLLIPETPFKERLPDVFVP